MQFHIDRDVGTAIVGWCVPDNPSAVPRIYISIPGRKDIALSANMIRDDIKNLGQHNTGMVGFVVDETIIPDLSHVKEIEIFHAETRLIIYRRIDIACPIERKLFRFELQAMPKTRLEEIFTQRFRLYYQAVERYPFDTLFAILNNQYTKSIYISGRPSLMRYQQLLQERDFITVTYLANPFDELAERLLFAQLVSRSKQAGNMTDHMAGLNPLFELAQSIAFEDFTTVESALGSLTEAQEQVISNPFVRVLACKINDIPNKHHIGIALDNLASMNVVGTRDRFHEFSALLSEILGREMIGDYRPPDLEIVRSLSTQLAEIPRVRKLLDLDLALYSYVEEALETVSSSI
jgi:hypothetical protein